MNYLENSTEFTVFDKYSNGHETKKRIHNSQLNERDINDIFYPFCSEVYISKKEIHVVKCEYSTMGYQITPNVKIVA